MSTDNIDLPVMEQGKEPKGTSRKHHSASPTNTSIPLKKIKAKKIKAPTAGDIPLEIANIYVEHAGWFKANDMEDPLKSRLISLTCQSTLKGGPVIKGEKSLIKPHAHKIPEVGGKPLYDHEGV